MTLNKEEAKRIVVTSLNTQLETKRDYTRVVKNMQHMKSSMGATTEQAYKFVSQSVVSMVAPELSREDEDYILDCMWDFLVKTEHSLTKM